MNKINAGGEFAGKYTLEERIGEGKFKETWKAFDQIMQRPVALKVFKERSVSIDALINEAANQTKLGKHKNIAQIYDAAIDANTSKAYICEEFIEGTTLKQTELTLNEKAIIKILIQLCEGLEYAHKKSIVHRDLKPENIFLTENDTVVITDWGGSTSSGPIDIPKDGLTGGSILFRAKEAIDGITDTKIDMYALGVLSYWLVTKEFPFTGNSYEEIKEKIRHMEPKNPSEYHSAVKISRKFEKIIMKMLGKNPNKRYSAKKLKRKLWVYKNRKKIAVATGLAIMAAPILSLVGVLGTLRFIGTITSMTLPKTDLKIMYLHEKKLKYFESIHPCRKDSDSAVRATMQNLFHDEIENYIQYGNKIFLVTKKDIYMNRIETKLNRIVGYVQQQITQTPDQEETNIQISPNGNFLAYTLGRDLYVIRVDGKFERKILEDIEEYVWYALKEQITYRKGNTIYITDTQEAPFAEKNARKIIDGIYPRWTDDGSYLFYIIKNENETSIGVKECGSSDFITGTKKIPGWKFPVEKSFKEFFLTKNSEVIADRFSLAYFVPEKQQLIIVKEKLGKKINPIIYPMKHFQDIRQIAFNPDMDGVLFSGKLLQEKDYEIFYYHLKPQALLRVTDNQEDDTNPILFGYKSPN